MAKKATGATPAKESSPKPAATPAPTPAPTPTPVPAPTAEKPVAPKREKMPVQHGVTRPTASTATGQVWGIIDAMLGANGEIPKRSDVIAAGEKQGLVQATIATQYGKYRKFHGLAPERPPAAPKSAATPTPEPTPPGVDVTHPDESAAVEEKARALGGSIEEPFDVEFPEDADETIE